MDLHPATVFCSALDEAKAAYRVWLEVRTKWDEMMTEKQNKKPAPYKHVKVDNDLTKALFTPANLLSTNLTYKFARYVWYVTEISHPMHLCVGNMLAIKIVVGQHVGWICV